MIIRRKHSANFTVIPNALLMDGNLSLDEVGLLCRLLMLPEDWTVRQDDMQRRCKVSKDKMQSLMRGLIRAGYVMRVQTRDPETKSFGKYEYHVYDIPQGAGEAANCNDPQPEIPATAGTGVNTPEKPNKKPQPENPAPGKPAPYKEPIELNPPSEGLSPPEGALEEKGQGNQPSPSQPPTLNARIWAEAKAILSPKEFGCVTSWLQRVRDKPKGAETLLGIIETARKQGTPQAVAYITGALNRVFPPPPDPKTITRERWELLVLAAMNPNVTWDVATYGPRPGEPGCLVPEDLVTPELRRAVAVRRVA